MANKMNPALKWTLIALPILIGGYFILRATGVIGKNKGKNKEGGDESKNSDVSSSGGTVSPKVQQYFPMQRGSKGEKVYELQQAILAVDAKALPKYGADKDFGSETEAAVLKLLKKKTVDSQDDIDKILKLKATADAQAALSASRANRTALAKKLIDTFNNKKSLTWYVDADTQVVTGILDAMGVERNSVTDVAKKGKTLFPAGAQLLITSVEPDDRGFLYFKLSGNKFLIVSPYSVYLK